MVARPFQLAALALFALGCAERQSPTEEPALVLRGFRWVDVESKSVREGELVVEHGALVERVTLPRQHVIEGHGRHLMPALWDLKSSLWGNDSAHNWDELMQEQTFTRCLQVQLYFGVAHVGAFGMAGDWVDRELRRADALGLTAAESLYPHKVLCSIDNFACEPIKTLADVAAALDRRQRRRVPFVDVSFVHDERTPVPAIPAELLAPTLAGAAARQLPSFVLVDDWAYARQAVSHDARVIYGFPPQLVPDDLVQQMRAKDVAFAPALTAYLELERLLGHPERLADPLLQATVRPDVLHTFHDERELWSEFRPDLAIARQRRDSMLQSVERLARAGVRILAAADAGWAPGTFQGYSSHALQEWFERAGLDGWTRLAAASTWPAALLGRRAGFSVGDPADFVALERDPVEHAAATRSIAWVMRRGKLVDREQLLPDLTRGDYVR